MKRRITSDEMELVNLKTKNKQKPPPKKVEGQMALQVNSAKC